MAVLHGWESADNAPRFDRALARIDPEGIAPIERTDTAQVAADERPTDLDYRRYLALVRWLRERGYRPRPPSSAPFAYLDLPLNSILAVAEDDLADLQSEIGADGRRARSAAARLRDALDTMWDDEAGAYRERDLHGEEGVTETIADLFPLYAGVPDAGRARRTGRRAPDGSPPASARASPGRSRRSRERAPTSTRATTGAAPSGST